ncbi:MAG: YraN family protein [Proteobacteria bacterium]|nr:YraN family protein [Pseudomonadota bacterium]TDJ34859.1 MAG: YraN family protein [Gammaproteobacteria bacterium]
MAEPTTIAVGARWENQALEHLLSSGLKLLTENFRCRMGEIDLVMLDQDCLVFVEVRYRKSNRFASAACSVDRHKQCKLARAAAMFLGRHPQYCDHSVRFDVVAFDATPDNQCTLQWLQDAFRPEN